MVLRNCLLLDFAMSLDWLRDERAQSEWSGIYMVIVFLIAAVVLIAVVKPLFQQSRKVVTSTPGADSGGK